MSTILNLEDAYEKAPIGIELRSPDEVQAFRDEHDKNVKFPYVWNVWASALAESGPDGDQFYVWAVYTHRPKENGVKPINYVCRKDVTDFPLDGYGDDGLFYKRIACDDKSTCQKSYLKKTPIWWEYGDIKQVMTVWSSDPNFLPDFGYVDGISGPINLCGYFTDSSNQFLPIQNANGEMVEGPSYPMVAIKQNQVINYGSKSRVEVWKYDVTKGTASAAPYYATTINAFNIKNGGIKSPHEGSDGPVNRVGKITMDPGLNGLEKATFDKEPTMHTIQLVDSSPSSPYETSGYGYFYLCKPGTNEKLLIDDNLGDQWILHKDNFYKDQYELPEHVDVNEVDLSNKKAPNAKLLDICQIDGKYLKLYENASLVEGEQIDGYEKKHTVGVFNPSKTHSCITCYGSTWIDIGWSGGILRSTDDGLTWTKICVVNSDLYGIYYSNDTWIIVGGVGTILRSTDDGLTWTKINVSGITSDYLYGIHYDNDTWIAVGSGGTIIRSTDDGLTWTKISVSGISYFPLKGVYYSYSTWIIVGSDCTILRSTNNGVSWTKITVDIVDSHLQSVYYANDTWIAVGDETTSDYATMAFVYRSIDDGLTWTKSETEVETILHGIYYSNSIWIAVGEYGTILRSTDDGLTWTQIFLNGISSILRSIYCANYVWIAVGENDSILRSANDSLTWERITLQKLSSILQSVAYDNNTSIAVGGGRSVLRSPDKGLTWTKINIDNMLGSGISLSGVYGYNNTWMIVGGSNGTILRSTDDGLTWSKITVSGVSASLNNIHYANNVWIAVGYGTTIIRSTDNGLTWSKITVSGVSSLLYSIHYSNNAWIIVGYSGNIIRSTDNGLNWSKITVSGISSNLFDIYYGNNTWIIVGISGIILRSTDNGLNWSKITVSGVTSALQGIYYSNNTWIIVGYSGTILRSTDNGLTWTKISISGLTSNLISISYSNNVWIAVGQYGTILRSIDNGLTWQFEAYNNSIFNIFSDTVHISNYGHSAIYHKDGSLSDITTQAFSDTGIEDYPKILDYKALDGFEARAIETLDAPRVEFRFKNNTEFGWSKKYFGGGIGDGIWITVGNSGTILRSTDNGLTWNTISVSGVNATLSSINYANNTWITVGNSGTILRSTDNGLTWNTISVSGVNATLSSINYANNTWITVGGVGAILRSTDNGLTWTKITSGVGNYLYGIHYANNVWIAVGDSGTLLRSTDDGLNWTKITSGVTDNLWRIHYSNHTWIIVGQSGIILRSTDNGLTWSKITSGVSSYLRGIYYSNNTWIIVGNIAIILRSTDNGSSWSKTTMSGVESNLQSIYYTNHTWIIVDSWGYIYKSVDDGITWSRVYDSNNRYVFNSITGRDVTYSPNQLTPYQLAEFSDPSNLDNRYLAIPESYQIALFDPTSKNTKSINRYGLTDDDFNCLYARENDLVAVKGEMEYTGGMKWVKIADDISDRREFYGIGVAYSGNLWIAVGSAISSSSSSSGSTRVGAIFSSTDRGITWTEMSYTNSNLLHDIYFSNGTWIAVGTGGIIVRSRDNGLTWTQINSGVGSNISLYRIYHANNTWIAVGMFGAIRRSTDDGLTWTRIDVTSDDINAICYANGIWIIGGFCIYRSTDNGLTWTEISGYGGYDDITDIDYGNGIWLMTGSKSSSYGSILRSTDNGLTWTAVLTLSKDGNATSIVYGNGVWIAAGDWGAFRVSFDNGLTWEYPSTPDISGGANGITYTGSSWIMFHGSQLIVDETPPALKFTTNALLQTVLIAKSATPVAKNYSISIRDLNISGYESYTYNYGIIPIQNKSYSLFGYSMRVDTNLWHTRYYIINIEDQIIVWTNPNLICQTYMKPQSKFKMVNGELILILDNDAAGTPSPQISYRIKLQIASRTPLPTATPTAIGKYPEDHVFQDAFVDHDPQFVYEKSYTSGNQSPQNRGSVPYDQIPVKIPGDPTKTYKKDRYLIPKPYMANIIEDLKDPYDYDNLPK